jgi:hypothetical protein
MKSQRKTTTRQNSAKDREFEQLLRRAALYAKTQAARDLTIAGRKRVAAA